MVELFSRTPDSLRPAEGQKLTPIPFDEDRLIPLKAVAWLDLNARRDGGERVDAKNIRKHANDILRLSQLLAATTRIPVETKIADDMKRFLDAAAADLTLDRKILGLGTMPRADVLGRIARAYGLEESA